MVSVLSLASVATVLLGYELKHVHVQFYSQGGKEGGEGLYTRQKLPT